MGERINDIPSLLPQTDKHKQMLNRLDLCKYLDNLLYYNFRYVIVSLSCQTNSSGLNKFLIEILNIFWATIASRISSGGIFTIKSCLSRTSSIRSQLLLVRSAVLNILSVQFSPLHIFLCYNTVPSFRRKREFLLGSRGSTSLP